MIRLSRAETAVYHSIWCGGVLYSLYRLYCVGTDYYREEDLKYYYDDFTKGWFGRLKDVSDFEWSCWTWLSIRLLPWLLVNWLGALIISRYGKQRILLSWWYCLVSLITSAVIVGRPATALFLVIVVLFYVSLFLKKAWIFWAIGFFIRRYVPSEKLVHTQEDIYLVEVCCSWIILRCLAYCCEVSKQAPNRFSTLAAYSLYLPTLFCGPLLPFPQFLRCSLQPRRFFLLTSYIQLFRCLFWYFFTNVAMHFVYVNATLLRPYFVEQLSTWELAGLGIATGHFFHLKYVVFYGIPSFWASTEGYVVPNAPCCVSRVYLYSVMWRCFDPGLYNFLVRYIYAPIRNKFTRRKFLSRTAGSVASFYFVYVWHGEETYVLYWVLLNLTAVTIESLAYDLCNVPSVKKLICQHTSPANQRRLHCLFAAPLHYFSMVSNFFFIGNHAVGSIFVRRALSESAINTIYILFILYGAAQSSLSIELERTKLKDAKSQSKRPKHPG